MKTWTLTAGAVLIALGVGIYLLASADTENPTIQMLQDRIAHLPLLPGSSNRLPEGLASGNGRIEAVQVDVTTKIAGRVSEIMVQEGDMVALGQTIAVIDTAQLQAQLLGAQADIASAESQVAAAKATVSQTQAQLVLAEQEMSRVSALVERQVATRETYDIRVSQRDVARANVAAAKAHLVSEQRGVDAARAVAQEIETQIEDSVLRATTAGRVLYRLSEPGEVLASGGKVVTLVNLNDVYMEIFLPSAQAFRVTVGSEARIKLDITDFAIPATVSFVSPESQFTPKQVETSEERDKLVFRVKVRAASELVQNYIEQIKTGVRGVAYVRLSGDTVPEWPEHLQNLIPAAPTSVGRN